MRLCLKNGALRDTKRPCVERAAARGTSSTQTEGAWHRVSIKLRRAIVAEVQHEALSEKRGNQGAPEYEHTIRMRKGSR